MKKDFDTKPAFFNDDYLKACGNMSWMDFVTGMPHLVFLVTGWKRNGKENACLQSWGSFVGANANDFICILSKVSKHGHMYQSLKETGVCVLNFPSKDIYDRCIKTIGHNGMDDDEITQAGLTAEPAKKVNAPRIRECHLNIECAFLWEHELMEGSDEVTIALQAVNICIESEKYDHGQLGRYGELGYLFQIDQATHPETGDVLPVNTGVLTPLEPIEWIRE